VGADKSIDAQTNSKTTALKIKTATFKAILEEKEVLMGVASDASFDGDVSTTANAEKWGTRNLQEQS
jgi:hypothetical protein